MIGSFWNLCRACPSMPVDKLHSEYRSTYRWHEYTGPRQEVVRSAPQGGHAIAVPPTGKDAHSHSEKRHDFGSATRIISEESQELPKLEPAMPRRKKYPDLAYRHHEFLTQPDKRNHVSNDNSAERARSEERGVSHWRPSRRSKSEGPARSSPRHPMNKERRRESDPDMEDTDRDTGLLKKAISKISTEYRLQFAWPHGHVSRRDASDVPRKSQSMGALKLAANAMIHRKKAEHTGTVTELEPLVKECKTSEEKEYAGQKVQMEICADDYIPCVKTEYKPLTNMEQVSSKENKVDNASKYQMHNGIVNNNEWFKEVLELRKKAGEYKSRGWGSKLAPELELYNKQVELWNHVSRRSSLSALSLASINIKTYNTKEEKNHENTKMTSPTKAVSNVENSTRLIQDKFRHHLHRTTGGLNFDGLILSPTREKLEPTVPKRDDDSKSSQRNSPKKKSPQKSKPNSIKARSSGIKPARSQSVGPTDLSSSEKRSPKRQPRSTPTKEKMTSSTAPLSTNSNAVNATTTKRPRPSSLSTTASSRFSSSSHPLKQQDEISVKSKPSKTYSNESKVRTARGRRGTSVSDKSDKVAAELSEADSVIIDHVIKSPPEPTRVKSPEQIIVRSPDPVNWTVPLDTGKTFTVTQNVRQGDIAARHHSDIKAWTPTEMLPPVAQSVQPKVGEKCKDQAGKSKTNIFGSPNLHTNSMVNQHSPNLADRIGKSVEDIDAKDDSKRNIASTATLEPNLCPYEILEPPLYTPSTDEFDRSIAGDVLQSARNRFDAFWSRSRSTDRA